MSPDRSRSGRAPIRSGQFEFEALLEQVGLTRQAALPCRYLSAGQRRRLALARLLLTARPLWLLDEPFAGVDPISVSDIKDIIRHLKQKGIGVLLTDHNVRETLDICEKAYIVSEGQIIAEGSSEEILANQKVREVYLGHQFRI